MIRHFSKMHGIGNDFAVFDATREALDLSPERIRQLADRHFGIGFDQMLLVEAPRSRDTEFYYRIFNADGSEVEQCGNGARCFARFVSAKKLSSSRVINVGTASGVITLYLEDNNHVRVNMGVPELEPAKIPLAFAARQDSYPVNVNGTAFEFSAVSMGNPHAVLRVDQIDSAPVHEIGPHLESHSLFPHRVNVGFMQVDDEQAIRLRVFERGSGETLACGTGACAAVVAGRQRGWLADSVTVTLPGGQLTVQWQGEGHPVWMTGPAEFVFEGDIEI
jgi:diaminopimelate epimerase